MEEGWRLAVMTMLSVATRHRRLSAVVVVAWRMFVGAVLLQRPGQSSPSDVASRGGHGTGEAAAAAAAAPRLGSLD